MTTLTATIDIAAPLNVVAANIEAFLRAEGPTSTIAVAQDQPLTFEETERVDTEGGGVRELRIAMEGIKMTLQFGEFAFDTEAERAEAQAISDVLEAYRDVLTAADPNAPITAVTRYSLTANGTGTRVVWTSELSGVVELLAKLAELDGVSVSAEVQSEAVAWAGRFTQFIAAQNQLRPASDDLGLS